MGPLASLAILTGWLTGRSLHGGELSAEQRAARLNALQRRQHIPEPWITSQHLTFSRRWLSALSLSALGGLRWAWPRPWRTRLRAVAAAGGVAGSAWVAARLGIRGLRVERVRLPVKGLRQPLRLLQISDFHFGSPHSRIVTQQALEQIAAYQPDLLLLTGDFLDRSRDLAELAATLQGHLKARLGVFACLGNHDYWSDPAGIARMLETQGVQVLLNEHRCLDLGDQVLVIAGITDSWYGDPDLALALRERPAEAPVLLLAHCPDAADEASAAGVDVQISGHTHAGHISLPGLGPLVLPYLGVKYHRGRYRIGAMWLYVNRGLAGLPLRLGAPPEVTQIELVPA